MSVIIENLIGPSGHGTKSENFITFTKKLKSAQSTKTNNEIQLNNDIEKG